jgi:hypothetical protein
MVVAQGGIARFQVTDRLRVLQGLQPPLHPFELCQIRPIVFSCPLFSGDVPSARATPSTGISQRAGRLQTADQTFDGDQLYTCVSVSPIRAARSLSDRRSVTRNASTPCS